MSEYDAGKTHTSSDTGSFSNFTSARMRRLQERKKERREEKLRREGKPIPKPKTREERLRELFWESDPKTEEGEKLHSLDTELAPVQQQKSQSQFQPLENDILAPEKEIVVDSPVPTPEPTVPSLIESGEQFYQLEDYQKAYSIFSEVIVKQPDNPEALFYLGVSANKTGKHSEAIALSEKWIESGYRTAQAYYFQGESYEALGQIEKAMSAYKEAGAEIPQARDKFLEMQEKKLLGGFKRQASPTENQGSTSSKPRKKETQKQDSSPQSRAEVIALEQVNKVLASERFQQINERSKKSGNSSLHTNRRRVDTTFNQSGRPTHYQGETAGLKGLDKFNGTYSAKTASIVNKQTVHQKSETKSLDVAELTPVEKLTEAVIRAALALPGEAGARIRAILTPSYLASVATVLGIYAASHAVGVGQVADVGFLIIGGIYLGKNAFSVIKDIIGFAGAINATTEAELDKAGQHLASAISTVGVNTVVALLTKKAATKIKDGVNSSRLNNPNRLPGNDGGAVTRTGRGQIEPRGNNNNTTASPVAAPSIFSIEPEGDNSQIEPASRVTQQFGEIQNLEPQTIGVLSQLDDAVLASLSGSLEAAPVELRGAYLNVMARDVAKGQALVEFRTFETPERFANVFNAIDSPSDVAIMERVFNENYLDSLSEGNKTRYQKLLDDIAGGTLASNSPTFEEHLEVLKEVQNIQGDIETITGSTTYDAKKVSERMVVYSKYEITDLSDGETISDNVVSLSGRGLPEKINGQSPKQKINVQGEKSRFVPTVSKKEKRLIISPDGLAIQDAERKIFIHILNELEKKAGIKFNPINQYKGLFKGKIEVSSQASPCEFCAEMINTHFRSMFGNDIEVIIKYGVTYTPPNNR